MNDIKAAKRRSLWDFLPKGFVQAVLAGHSSLGLLFGAILYLVCLTGTLSVFVEEYILWETASAPTIDSATVETMEAAVASLDARFDEPMEHIFLSLPRPELPQLGLTTDAGGEFTRWISDADGNVVSGDTPWTSFITGLHIHLHFGNDLGHIIVGLSGVALLSLLISGILAHPRIFRDAFHLRWGGSRRLQEADLHNRLSIWGLPFHILISLTGALLGLVTLIVGVLALALFQGDTDKAYALFLTPEPAEDPRSAAIPDLASAYAALSADTDGTPSHVELHHPQERGSAITFTVPHENGVSRGDTFSYNRNNELTHSSLYADLPLGQRILGVLGILHFGWFGGLLVKIAYASLGLALTVVTSSGIRIWLERRRDKGQPAPRWENLWSAFVWGQPLGLALAALIALWVQSSTASIVAWAMISVATVLAGPFLTAQKSAAMLKAALCGVLLSLPISQFLRFGGDQSTTAYAVNLILVLCSLLFSAALYRHSCRKRSQPEAIRQQT